MAYTADDNAYDQRLGQRIKLFREQCGLSAEQLAGKLGEDFTGQLIHDYEMGNESVPVVHLARLAEALDAANLLMYDLPFANASDWQFYSQYRTLSRRCQQQIRQWVICMACDLPLVDY